MGQDHLKAGEEEKRKTRNKLKRITNKDAKKNGEKSNNEKKHPKVFFYTFLFSGNKAEVGIYKKATRK